MAGDPKVLGRTIRRTANDAVFTIVGVLPPDFKFATDEFALWAPLNTDPNYRDRDEHSLLVFAKLNATVTPEQAQAMMNGVARQLAEEFPKSEGWSITVKPLQQFYAGVRNVRQTLLVLLAAVALLLAIACLNIANLLLARGAVRTKETVVRLAIGATQQRLARQLIAESVLLGLFGGLAGFLLARLTFASLIAAAPHIPSFRPHAIRLNYEAFAFAIAVSILASVAFGLAPALWASRTELSEHLREAGRVRRGAADTRMRHLLVTGELAVTVVLLAGAGLLLETFRNLETDALGFNTSHIVTAGVCCLDETHYRTERDSSMFYRQLFERLRSTPGVESVSGATDLPLRHVQGSGSPFDVRERPAQVPGEQPTADLFFVEPTYFRTLGIAVTRGRVFADDDDEARAPVAVINESLARRLWTDRDPIGQEIHPLDRIAGSRWYRIIGVVADTKERGLGTDVQPTIYRSYYQSLARFTFLLIRTRSAPGPMLPALKEALESVSRGLPVNDFRTLDDALAESVSAQRFSALLLALFAALALGLASVGVYGVTAYTVVQRTREVGIRMALGASTREIRRMVLREGLMHATVGLTVGTLGAFAFARYLRALLYGVAAGDPLTLAIPVLLLFLTTLAACSIPAWRAARVDPIRALRCE